MVRFDVYSITFPRRRGHVQHGRRYAVIVQADGLLALSTVICPTSASAPPASFHPEIVLGDEPIRVICEIMGAVDIRAIGDQVAHLSAAEISAVAVDIRAIGDQVAHLSATEISAVDDAMAMVLGLS